MGLELKIGETNFNVQDIHVKRISQYVNQFGNVIIHGDGMMFTGPDAKKGSDYHRQFNAGVEINKKEAISRAKFRAIYDKSSTMPKTPDDVLAEFYSNANKEMQEDTKHDLIVDNRKSILIKDEDPAPSVKEDPAATVKSNKTDKAQ